ncbi:hypothetical protein V1504DRAFT_464873 [Lipomyces starkeyi]
MAFFAALIAASRLPFLSCFRASFFCRKSALLLLVSCFLQKVVRKIFDSKTSPNFSTFEPLPYIEARTDCFEEESYLLFLIDWLARRGVTTHQAGELLDELACVLEVRVLEISQFSSELHSQASCTLIVQLHQTIPYLFWSWGVTRDLGLDLYTKVAHHCRRGFHFLLFLFLLLLWALPFLGGTALEEPKEAFTLQNQGHLPLPRHPVFSSFELPDSNVSIF